MAGTAEFIPRLAELDRYGRLRPDALFDWL